jgi:Tfp pilus assembly protein PilF
MFFLTSLSITARAFALDKTAFVLSHYIMATVYEDLGDIEGAIREYKKALKADYKNALIHLKLAASYIRKNDIPKAIEELNNAIKFEPEAVEPHAVLALLYSAKNQVDLATREYEIALKNASKLQPANIDIYRGLGALYLQQNKLKEAENTYRLILDLHSPDAEAHFYLANIYDKLKMKDKVIEELKRCIEINPVYHEALNYLGYLYVEEDKNLDQAETMIRKALEMQPDNGAYIDSLGWLYFKRGKLQEAVKELQRASSLLEDPVIYDHLGDAYFKLDDYENAKASWQKSLKLDPKQDNVEKKVKRK